MTRAKILARLAMQEDIEGNTEGMQLLKRVVDCCERESEWRALARVEYYKYGKLSHEAHVFYYPSALLLKLTDKFTNRPDRHQAGARRK